MIASQGHVQRLRSKAHRLAGEDDVVSEIGSAHYLILLGLEPTLESSSGLYPVSIPAIRVGPMENPALTLGPRRPQRSDAARNRQVLLATAREMLAELGADKITMDALAERAGVGKGTVFRRFGTRAGIFQALLDDDEA